MAQFESWKRNAAVMLPESIAARVRPDAEYEAWEWPDAEELFETKWLAEQLGVPVGLYAMQTFGGSTEYEWAWEFGPRERVFKCIEQITTTESTPKSSFFGIQRPVRHHRRTETIFELDGDRMRAHPDKSALQHLPASLGVPMPSRFFTPHERGFDWGRYRAR